MTGWFVAEFCEVFKWTHYSDPARLTFTLLFSPTLNVEHVHQVRHQSGEIDTGNSHSHVRRLQEISFVTSLLASHGYTEHWPKRMWR
jgi:hypothetical protein